MMASHYLDSLKAKFAELRPEDSERLVPCSEIDVSDLERKLSIKLPDAYREFLLWTGQTGGFLSFTYCNCHNLQQLDVGAREILSQVKPSPHLPGKAFVFALDQSPMFCFFRIGDGDDPKVYLFIEPGLKRYFQEAPKESWPLTWQFLYDARAKNDFHEFEPSFTSFLNAEMDRYIQTKQRTEAWRASHKRE